MERLPRTWLSTQFSTPARETEGRLRNLFQGLKKRPPVIALLAAALAAALCGNLIACQGGETPPLGGQEIPGPAPAEVSSSPVAAMDRERREELTTVVSTASMCQIGGWMEYSGEGPRGSEVLAFLEHEGDALIAMEFYMEDRVYLSVGLVKGETGELEGELFLCEMSGGVPQVAAFERDGAPHLLYTFNASADRVGRGGCVTLRDSALQWIWPVTGDLRSGDSGLLKEYEGYWGDRYPLLTSGGVEVFVRDSAGGWLLETVQTFYDPGEEALLEGQTDQL